MAHPVERLHILSAKAKTYQKTEQVDHSHVISFRIKYLNTLIGSHINIGHGIKHFVASLEV